MNDITLFIIVLNLVVALIYSLILKKNKKSGIIPIFIIMILIPVYGLIIVGILDTIQNKKYPCTIEPILEIEDEVKDKDIDESTIQIEEILNSMSIDDILAMSDVKLRRKMLFKSVNGNFSRLYPFLKRMLNDYDSEVIHYASAAISNHTQEVNGNLKISKEIYLENPSDITAHLSYIDNLIEVILWGELDGMDMLEERKILEEELESIFNSQESINEKYYIEKYQNEIKINEFGMALATCKRYLKDFPKSENAFFSLMELGYCSKNLKMFYGAMESIENSGIELSSNLKEIILFWKDINQVELSQQDD